MESARFVQDIAKPLAQVYREIPADQMPTGEWTRQKQGWISWHGMAARLQAIQPSVNSFSAMAMSSANSAVAGAVTWFAPFHGALQAPPAAASAMTSINQTLERFPLFEKALSSMRRIGLDRRGGDSRPALDLLHEAKGSMERPVVGDGGAVSVLISLRECIGAAITELVRRRPKQEEARRWSAKLVSVGSQCARASLSAGHFARLGEDADRLMDQLSGAKQTCMDRAQLIGLFNRGLLFLNAMMDSIDESTLKPS